MEEWKSYKLGDISTIQTGPFGSQLHQSDYVESGVPCIMPTNIGRMLDFQVAGIAHISEGDALKLSRHIVHEGDIVYSRRGDIEKCAYVSQEQDGWFCGTGCLKITINSNLAVPKFVAYYLSTDEIKSWIVGNAVGTTMLNLNTSVLADVPLSLPSIQMQKRCVQILDSIENKIALNNRINHNLEEQAQALYKSWFVDFEPFKDGKFVDSELGMIPEGWQVKNLLEVASLYDSKRKPLSGNERSQMEHIYPYYGATSVMDYVDGFIFDGTYLLMGEDGSVMTEEGFPFLQYVTGKFWPNNHAHVMQGCNGFSTEMLHCALLRKVIKSSVTGAVQAKISQANMKKIQFTFPSRDILVAFDNLLQKIYSQIRIITSQNVVLSLVRDNMLPRLISGKLDF